MTLSHALVLGFTMPEKFKDNLAYGLMVIIAVAAVFCIIKCIQGADMLDRGEDGKKKIYSGIAIGVAPWLAMAAFEATGLWDTLGLSLVPGAVKPLPPELVDVIQLACWAVIGISAIWCVIKCIAGANQLERGEDGKKKIFSGLAIAAAPWVAIVAMNLAGFWDALGLSLV
ncbi:hypothetical protein [Opitutus sp. ER46]|uniref:hypothetical protein n=1 Tax=Opitutus sp. ER46 TaxID=2161864 RepID=UPI000D30CEB5|nr:hypothetical protein [Opitutus sp. ER46]PTX91327.1 hypothetical protein DB354_15635 [Opitutus sp. ER46]